MLNHRPWMDGLAGLGECHSTQLDCWPDTNLGLYRIKMISSNCKVYFTGSRTK